MPAFDRAVLRTLDALRLRAPAKRLLEATPAAALLRWREIHQRPRLVAEAPLTQVFTDGLAWLASAGCPIGDYLEFGVYNGTSLITMQRVLRAAGNTHTRLIGFDSFEGLPEIAATDSEGHWYPGQYRCTLEFTRRVLDHERADWSRIHLVKGYFASTLTPQLRTELALSRASLIMIDCDLYQSTKDALEFCTPLIVDRAVLFFDDWYPLADRNMGEKAAFDQWLAGNPGLVHRELSRFDPRGKAFVVCRT